MGPDVVGAIHVLNMKIPPNSIIVLTTATTVSEIILKIKSSLILNFFFFEILKNIYGC